MRVPLALALVLAFASPASPATRVRTIADCDALLRREPQSLESFRCYVAVAHYDGKFDIARRHLAAAARRDAHNPRALLALGIIDQDQRRDTAVGYYERAADLARVSADPTTEATARILLSAAFGRRQRFEQAEGQLAQAAVVASTSAPAEQAAVDLARAGLALARHDYGQATILLKQIEPRIFPDGTVDLRSRWLGTMASASWSTGRADESERLYSRQVDLLAAAGNRFDEAWARVNLVLLASSNSRSREELLRLAQAALTVATTAHNVGAEGGACFHIAELSSGREAVRYVSRSLDIARRTHDVDGVMMGLRGKALSLAEFDAPEAFRLIDEAIAQARGRGDIADVARNSIVRSRIAWRVGAPHQAIADSEAALDAIEAERDLQPDSLVRALRFSSWRVAYDALSGQLLLRNDVARAFRTTERMRARSLLDAMDAAQATAAALPAGSNQAARSALLARVADVRRRLLDPTLADRERRAATEEFERLQRDEAESRVALASADAVFAALHAPRLATLEDVDRVLAPDQALLSFHMARNQAVDGTFLGGSWLIVRTRGSSRVYRLPDDNAIDSEVQLFLGLIARRDGSDAAGAARLYGDLLERALGDMPAGIKRLVIVPDRTLNALPFDALRARPDAAPLAERYETSTAPSATMWVRWRGTQPLRGPAFVVADPDLASTRSTPAALVRLARARREGRTIVDRLGAPSELRVGSRANEYDLKHQDLSRFAVLHFATHALVDAEHPDRAALLLAAGSPLEDGWLRPREIVPLHLGGQLVVLSACLSASGAVIGGEGVLGLAHAFFQAGAHAVIGGLWPLRDDEAADLVEALYRHLARGERIASALAAARRERLSAGAPTAGWAGLTLIGDGDSSPLSAGQPTSRRWTMTIVALAVMLSAAGLLAWWGASWKRAPSSSPD